MCFFNRHASSVVLDLCSTCYSSIAFTSSGQASMPWGSTLSGDQNPFTAWERLIHYPWNRSELASVYLADPRSSPCKDFEMGEISELSIMLGKTEFERDIYMNECRETKIRIDELESKIKEMNEQFSETVKIRDEYYNVIRELKSTQGELLSNKAKVVEAQDAEREALKQAELMETALNIEKQKTEELQGHVSVINETILCMQLAALEAEKENIALLSKKQSEILSATKLVEEAHKELETMRNQQPGSMQTLEKELMRKTLLLDSLQLELQKANDLHKSAQKATSEAVSDINQLIADTELLVTENSDKCVCINFLETELTQLKHDYKNAKKDVEIANEDRERLRRAVETANKDVEHLYRDVEIANKDRERLNKDVENAKIDRERLNKDFETSDRDRERLAKDVEIANKDREHLNKVVETAKKDVERLYTDVEIANKERERLNKDVEKANKNIEHLNKDLETANKDRERLTKDVEIANEDRERLYKVVETAKEDVERLYRDVEIANKDRERLNKDVENAKRDIGRLNKDVEIANKEIERLYKDVEIANNDKEGLNQDVETANKYRERNNKDVQTANKCIHSFYKDVEIANKDEEIAKKDVEHLTKDVETLTCKFESIKNELDVIRGKENEAQVEIAFLKSELQNGISKIAAAEAAEEKAKLENLTIRLNIQQLKSEAEEAYEEIRGLKEEADTRADRGVTDNNVTVSVEEYNALVEKANREDKVRETMTDDRYELEALKKDLEITTARIGEFRTRAEQAAFRAEAAEKSKAALEEHIRRLREQKERRKFAHQALKEASITPTFNYKQDLGLPPKTHPPLGKILNMKF